MGQGLSLLMISCSEDNGTKDEGNAVSHYPRFLLFEEVLAFGCWKMLLIIFCIGGDCKMENNCWKSRCSKSENKGGVFTWDGLLGKLKVGVLSC